MNEKLVLSLSVRRYLLYVVKKCVMSFPIRPFQAGDDCMNGREGMYGRCC
jgi:hypothetical protein